MGKYTDFKLVCEMKANCPGDIKQTLSALVNGIIARPNIPHPFFDSTLARVLATGAGDYFNSTPICRFGPDDCGDWILEITSALMNYDHEIEKFLDWVYPYIYTEDEALGYFRCEDNNLPTVFLVDDGELHFYSCGKRIAREWTCES